MRGGGGEVAPHAVGDGEGFVEVANRNARGKLFAADAAENDIGAERRRRAAGEGLQYGVTVARGRSGR